MKYFTLTMFVLVVTPAFTQSQQQILRSQLQKAPGNILHISEEENSIHKEGRAVIFYDDFSNPSNWILMNLSTPSYDWEITNSLPANLLSQNFGPAINSTSGGSFALVNSDGQGNGATQLCRLTTVNPINCLSNPNVQLRFENYHRIFYETHTVYVSNDGVNYDPYPVNTTYGAGNNNYVTSPNMEEVTVNITPTAGSEPTVWIRFEYSGSYDWFWAIDDVILEDLPDFIVEARDFGYCDLNPSPVLGERIEHTILPITQERDIKFLGDFRSDGATFLNNARIALEISNSVSTIIHTDTTIGGMVNSNWITDSLIWSSIATMDDYTINLDVLYDSISVPLSGYQFSNNYSVSPQQFDAIFARDNGIYSSSGLWNGAGNPYILGNEFVPTNNIDICGLQVAFAPGTDVGAVVCVQLYELDPTASNFNGIFIPVIDNCLDGIEHTISPSDISSGNNVTWVPLLFSNFYTLQAGKSYMAAINHYGGTEEVVIMKGGNTIRDAATVFIYDPTATSGGPWFYTTSIPMIRLVSMYECTISVPEIGNEMNMAISPNPANQTISINYDLNYSSDVEIFIYDIAGKEVKSVSLGNNLVGEQSVQVDVSDLSEGAYVFKLKTDQSEQSSRMIIAR